MFDSVFRINIEFIFPKKNQINLANNFFLIYFKYLSIFLKQKMF